MKNEPVVWINLDRFKDEALYLADCVSENKVDNMGITTPLYTHPAKPLSSVVVASATCSCGKVMEVTNLQPAKTLTDEEVMEIVEESYMPQGLDKSRYTGFARAILRKAQEK